MHGCGTTDEVAYARAMSALTSEFYAQVSESFSATRASGWVGWERLVAELGLESNDALTLLDVACGNLRLERYLAARVACLESWCYDNCDALVRGAKAPPTCHLRHLDIASALLEDSLSSSIDAGACDLAVSLAFMHHLPLERQRAGLLKALVDHTRSQGHVVVSFWQFADDERQRAKAYPVATGYPGDYLMGWQQRTDVRRFCHHADETEIDRLVEAVSPSVSDERRFSADGRSGTLNRYLVLTIR